MANKLYDKAREAFRKGDIDWLNGRSKVVLVDTADYIVVERRGDDNRPCKL